MLHLKKRVALVGCSDGRDWHDKLTIDALCAELEKMGLAAPQITYIMHALKEKGLDVDVNAITVEEEKDSIMGIPLVNVALKEKIGKIAASRVNGSGWIFIGQGTTCYYVAKELAKLETVNVLTNNLMAAQALAKNKRANVVVTGGNMINSHLYVAGEMFMRNLDNLYISTAFLGVGGADMHAGYTVNYSTELTVFETIQKLTDNLIIVVDSTKFDRTTFLSLGKLEYVC